MLLVWLLCGSSGPSGLRSVSPFSGACTHYAAIALRTWHFTPRVFAHGGVHSHFVSQSWRESRRLRLPHKAIRHLCLTFNTQFPWIVGKKSKPSLLQFLQHECLSADPHPTRPPRMSSLGANQCAYLADSAPHGLANVELHCGTAALDSAETCCGW